MTPDLAGFDAIVINSSGGKDSQAMLTVVVEQAAAAGVLDRCTVFHADLGEVEWPGTRELAAEQAAHYGLRFEVRNRRQGDLLQQIEQRRMFPDAARRYCTSDQKRAPGRRLLTQLVNELKLERRARILNCMGFRAQESPARSKRAPVRYDESASNKSRRAVTEWLPIHDWTEDQVWARIRESGVRHHPAYDMGMPRLSCSFCVLASKTALVRAAQLRPELAARYAELEARIGHTFRQDLSMAKIVELAAEGNIIAIESWNA